jgi:hypothetical protein
MTMNEPNFPMDDDLSRFEQDLKSLTPKHFPTASPVRAILPKHDLGLSSYAVVGVDTCQQSHRFAFVNRTWLKTVSVAWVTGLAAGLLAPAMWTGFVNEEAPFIKPNLISESGVSSVVTTPTPPTTATPDSPSIKPTRSQEPSRYREQSSASTNRYTSLNSHDDQMLHPFMSLNEVHWNSAMMPSAKRLTGVAMGPKQDDEQNSAPYSTSDVPQTTLPNSFPKTQGQRQLLKSLMESDDLISI